MNAIMHKYCHASNAPRLHNNNSLDDTTIQHISVVELEQQVRSFTMQFGHAVDVTLSITKEQRGQIREPFGVLRTSLPQHIVDSFNATGNTNPIDTFINSAVSAGVTGPRRHMPRFTCNGIY